MHRHSPLLTRKPCHRKDVSSWFVLWATWRLTLPHSRGQISSRNPADEVHSLLRTSHRGSLHSPNLIGGVLLETSVDVVTGSPLPSRYLCLQSILAQLASRICQQGLPYCR